MRELSSGDIGLLLSVFVLLLIAFGLDVHLSRRAVRRSRRAAILAVVVSLVGETTAALSLVLTWIALWSPAAWERIDDLIVFVPGSVAVLCAVILTGEKALSRVITVATEESSRGSEHGGMPEGS